MTCSPRSNYSPGAGRSPSSSSSSSSSRRSRSRSQSRSRSIRAALEIADAASWYCSIVIVALVLLSIMPFDHDSNNGDNFYDDTTTSSSISSPSSSTTTRWRGSRFLDNNRPCDEIYVVSEGETLHTISDKCGDPFIVERNPHIHDPDDVFPGLVIKITPLVVKN